MSSGGDFESFFRHAGLVDALLLYVGIYYIYVKDKLFFPGLLFSGGRAFFLALSAAR